MTNTDHLIRIGQALWGERWQAPMARAVGVNRFTVHAWSRGEYQPRDDIWETLHQLAELRREELDELLEETE